ncbi:unnamed protein product [Arctogadus glacialis]
MCPPGLCLAVFVHNLRLQKAHVPLSSYLLSQGSLMEAGNAPTHTRTHTQPHTHMQTHTNTHTNVECKVHGSGAVFANGYLNIDTRTHTHTHTNTQTHTSK